MFIVTDFVFINDLDTPQFLDASAASILEKGHSVVIPEFDDSEVQRGWSAHVDWIVKQIRPEPGTAFVAMGLAGSLLPTIVRRTRANNPSMIFVQARIPPRVSSTTYDYDEQDDDDHYQELVRLSRDRHAHEDSEGIQPVTSIEQRQREIEDMKKVISFMQVMDLHSPDDDATLLDLIQAAPTYVIDELIRILAPTDNRVFPGRIPAVRPWPAKANAFVAIMKLEDAMLTELESLGWPREFCRIPLDLSDLASKIVRANERAWDFASGA